MTVKKKQEKEKRQKKDEECVIIGERGGKMSDIFDLSEEEWEQIARECSAAERAAKNVDELALGFGVKDGGTMALRGYFFGRAVGELQMKANIVQALMESMKGDGKGDENGN